MKIIDSKFAAIGRAGRIAVSRPENGYTQGPVTDR